VAETAHRRRRPDARPEEILDAATRVLSTAGLAGTTMAAVADEAAVAKGTVYLYFPSKSDLLAAVRARYLERFAAALGGGVDADPRDELHRFVGGLLTFSFSHQALHHALFHEAGFSEVDALSRARAALVAIVSRGVTDGRFTARDPELAGSFLLHGLHGTLVDTLHSADHDVARAASELVVLMERALGVDPPGGT